MDELIDLLLINLNDSKLKKEIRGLYRDERAEVGGESFLLRANYNFALFQASLALSSIEPLADNARELIALKDPSPGLLRSIIHDMIMWEPDAEVVRQKIKSVIFECKV